MANEGPREPGPVDRLALLMLDEWRRVEPDKPVGPCLMETIADLARVALAWSEREREPRIMLQISDRAVEHALANALDAARQAEQALAVAVAERDHALARVAELEDAVRRGADLVGW